MVVAHPLRRYLGEAESRLSRFLDCGGLADPVGGERRVAASIQGRAVAPDLGVRVGDGAAQLVDLAGGVVGSARCPVLSFGHLREVQAQRGSGEFSSEEPADRVADLIFA
ncbi:hypothetical protein [Actinoplanes sp. NPDC049681]|uniref:hypothetical protein n=1 Tax=Actinoplanes sp. NPDC049681 TaxID=3363905 RepID=UPI003789D2C5